MTLPRRVIADLAALSASMDDPNIDLEMAVGNLEVAARVAVPSYLGLSLRIGTLGESRLVTLFGDVFGGERVSASVLIPPGRDDAGGDPGSEVHGSAGVGVVLYAAAPGAFIDLAADLARVTGRDLSAFELDQHLAAVGDTAVPFRLSDWFTTNQAVGMLIASGLTLKQAEAELAQRARRQGVSRNVAAATIVASLPVAGVGRPRDGSP